jgi:hypothetical protein
VYAAPLSGHGDAAVKPFVAALRATASLVIFSLKVRSMRPRWRWSVAAAALAAGCLFETTPPQRTPRSGEPPPDPAAVVITGLVQVFDRVDHDVTPGRNWGVQITWYKRDGNGDGQLDVLGYSNLVTDQDGVYQASWVASALVAIDIQPRKCPEEADVPPCCVSHTNPCGGPECNAWLPPTRLSVTPGQRLHENLTVRCDYVP